MICSVMRPPRASCRKTRRGAHIRRQQVDVVDPPQGDAAIGVARSLVLERRAQILRRLVPLGFVIDFHLVPIGVGETVGGSMPNVFVVPAPAQSGSFQARPPAAGAPAGWTRARHNVPGPALRRRSVAACDVRNHPSRAGRPSRPSGRSRSSPSPPQKSARSPRAWASAIPRAPGGPHQKWVLGFISFLRFLSTISRSPCRS